MICANTARVAHHKENQLHVPCTRGAAIPQYIQSFTQETGRSSNQDSLNTAVKLAT